MNDTFLGNNIQIVQVLFHNTSFYVVSLNPFQLSCDNNIVALTASKCKMFDYAGAPIRGNLVGNLDVLYKNFEIKFQVNSSLNGNSDFWNVLQMTNGGDNSFYGNRIPAIFLDRVYHQSSWNTHNRMETYFSLNGVIGLRKDFVIPQNQWVDVQMTQKKIVDEYVFEYRVGNKTETLINREPANFKDVLAWVSSPFTETLTTSYFGSIKIRNFEVCTPGRNCKSISIFLTDTTKLTKKSNHQRNN